MKKYLAVLCFILFIIIKCNNPSNSSNSRAIYNPIDFSNPEKGQISIYASYASYLSPFPPDTSRHDTLALRLDSFEGNKYYLSEYSLDTISDTVSYYVLLSNTMILSSLPRASQIYIFDTLPFNNSDSIYADSLWDRFWYYARYFKGKVLEYSHFNDLFENVYAKIDGRPMAADGLGRGVIYSNNGVINCLEYGSWFNFVYELRLLPNNL